MPLEHGEQSIHTSIATRAIGPRVSVFVCARLGATPCWRSFLYVYGLILLGGNRSWLSSCGDRWWFLVRVSRIRKEWTVKLLSRCVYARTRTCLFRRDSYSLFFFFPVFFSSFFSFLFFLRLGGIPLPSMDSVAGDSVPGTSKDTVVRVTVYRDCDKFGTIMSRRRLFAVLH